MIRRPPRSTRTATLFPTRRSADLPENCLISFDTKTTHSISIRLNSPAASILSRFALANGAIIRSEEHTSELQSLMRISYAVFCLNKKPTQDNHNSHLHCRIANTIDGFSKQTRTPSTHNNNK